MEIKFNLDMPDTITLETIIGRVPEYDDDDMLLGYREVTIGDELVRRVAGQVEIKVQSDLSEIVREKITALATEKAQALIEEAVEGAFLPTDRFGNATGKPTSIREFVLKTAKEFLEKPSRRTTYAEPKTQLQELIEGAVDSQFKKDISVAIDEGKSQALQAVREQAAEILAKTIAKMAEKGGE